MNHLQRTTCCNHHFTANDIQPPIMKQREALGTNEPHLYGGNAKSFAKTTCPECGKRYLMWMKPKSPNYKILTLSDLPEETEVTQKRRGRQPSTV